MDKRAQVSMEYLLILAAVLTLLSMIMYITLSSAGSRMEAVNQSTQSLNQSINSL